MKILLVDDNSTDRYLIKKTLERIGVVAEIHEADDGDVAIEKVNDVKPDIVFLDIIMLRVHGLEVLEYIKREHPKTTVIMLSTSDAETDIAKSVEREADAYISKPAAPAAFIEKLKTFKSIFIDGHLHYCHFDERNKLQVIPCY